jgi:segregation and condensation protein B
VDSIRGVSSDGVLRSLLSKGLVEEVGRTEGPGRPILYGTTTEFLQHFGLTSLSELPTFEPGEDESFPVVETKLLKD